MFLSIYLYCIHFSSNDEPPYVKPAMYSRPDFIALDTYKARFLYLEERIPVIGTAIKTGLLRCTETGQSKQLAVVFRLLNNGAVYAQRFVTMDETYSDFDRPPPTRVMQQQGWTLDATSQQQSYQLFLGDGLLEAHIKLKQKEHMNRYSMYHVWDSSTFFKGNKTKKQKNKKALLDSRYVIHFIDIIYGAVTTKLSVHKTGVHLHGSNLLEVGFPANM